MHYLLAPPFFLTLSFSLAGTLLYCHLLIDSMMQLPCLLSFLLLLKKKKNVFIACCFLCLLFLDEEKAERRTVHNLWRLTVWVFALNKFCSLATRQGGGRPRRRVCLLVLVRSFRHLVTCSFVLLISFWYCCCCFHCCCGVMLVWYWLIGVLN